MPSKYMIHAKPAPHRFKALSESGIIAWEEGCLKCAVCVKKGCVYGVYDNRALDGRQMMDSLDHACMSCLRCVQGCPKELIHKTLSPEYKAIGDTYWTPDIVTKLWSQSETGKIPVSGAGYHGPFSGPGFDSMWTDMSEIVRPTRDGIHGREYISTAVDLGKTPGHLDFDADENLVGESPRVLDLPLPIIMRVPSFGAINEATLKGWAMAAKHLGTLLVLPHGMLNKELDAFRPYLAPMISSGTMDSDPIGEEVRLVEIPWKEDWEKSVKEIRKSLASALISVRLPLKEGVEEKALSLAKFGVSIVHVEGSDKGRVHDDESRFVKDGIRSVHMALVEAGVRNEMSLLASGGMGMAEHVPKSIISGADAVLVDFPILISLECRMCRRCTKGLSCPVDIDQAPSAWVASRVVNLLGAWHSQLLEVMGAMGIRDVRRLRGEIGRAMFFEDLDESTFGSMNHVDDGYELE